MRTIAGAFFLFQVTFSLCPDAPMQEPCSCFSTRYEAVSIVCDGGTSLDLVLESLATFSSAIDSLTISNTPIETLPGYVFQGHRITKLYLRNNGLRYFHPNTFTGDLENDLQELEVRGNYIDSIPQSGVTKLKNLKTLSFPDNLIEYVHDNAFLSYHSRSTLTKIDLSANNLTAIHPTGLLGLESLIELSLDRNLLSNVPIEALENIPTLEDLSLGVNRISTVSETPLPLPRLKSLSLEVNQIRKIPASFFSMTPHLLYLYLGNNLLTSVDSSMFYFIEKLKVLSINNNKDITSLQSNGMFSTFQHVPNLNRLELSDCSVNRIEPETFRKTPQLQVVILSRNHLTRISHETFSHLPQVSSIDLSGNSINSVDDLAFSQLPLLTTLDLSSNRLETLPNNVLYDSLIQKKVPVERKLLIQNNLWRCDKNLDWLRAWLRENRDVQITSSAKSAKCWTPSNLSGLDLRQSEATHKSKPVSAAEDPTSSSNASEEKLNKTEYQKPHTEVNGLALVGLILGIIVIVFVSCIVLGYLMKHIFLASDNSQETSVTGFDIGSLRCARTMRNADKASLSGESGQKSSANTNVYLNRPRHWWF